MDTSDFTITGTTPKPAQPVLSPIQPQQTPVGASQPQIQPVSSAPQGGLDPHIVTLAQSIRQVESNNNFQAVGKSGEYGAYQFEPATWAAAAQKFGVQVPLDQATPEQQNEVAYKQLASWAQEHPDWNVGNFASAWNAGEGKPNAYLEGNSGVNAEGVSYDTGAYAQKVAQTYQQLKAQNPQLQQTPQTPGQTQPQGAPSVGGFLGNVVQSGANFAGNLVNAAIHPIQTIQGLGSDVAGGLQELGGQTNSNTQNFDNLKNYFTQRYGGVSNIENSVYQDPVGVLSDISAVLGVGAGVAGAAGKVGELSGIADAGNIASETASTLGKAAELTNPLTPVISGASKILGSSPVESLAGGIASQVDGLKPAVMADIITNPDNYTPEQIATVTRTAVASQVAEDFAARDAQLNETGSEYEAIKSPQVSQAGTAGFEGMKNNPPDNAVPVQRNFIEDQLRSVAKVNVEDGNIIPSGSSVIRASKDVAALQKLLDTWKPEFQKGYLTPEEYLNFRQDLAGAAKFDREFSSSKPVEGVAAGIRTNLNTDYRGAIPGLEELDTRYAEQRTSFDDLRKGLFDKEGNLTDSAVNKIANATGKGKDAQLARLEEISPGITQKIKTMRNIEQIQNLKEGKIGTFPSATLKAGGAIYGLATGDMRILGTSLATMFLAEPDIAVPLMRAIGYNKELFGTITSNMIKYLNAGAVGHAITSETPNTPAPIQQQSQQEMGQDSSSPNTTENPNTSPQSVDMPSLEKLAANKNFNLDAALKAGYSPQDIQQFLQTN